MDPIIEMMAQVGCEEAYPEDEEPEGHVSAPATESDEDDVPF